MDIELLQSNTALWAVRRGERIIGALKYLGSAKWEYMDEDGEHHFDANNVDEARTHITALVKAKVAAAAEPPTASVDIENLKLFFRHQLRGFEALAQSVETGVAPYIAELMISVASVLSDIDDEARRTEARSNLIALLDGAIERTIERKRRMAGIGSLLSSMFEEIERRSRESDNNNNNAPPDKPLPTH